MTVINVRPLGTQGVYNAYGGCLEFLKNKDSQVILYGGAGSGKTTSACWKLLMFCTKYPGVKALMTRNSYVALVKSGVETFERVCREAGYQIGKKDGASNVIYKLGESKPTEYKFPYAKRVEVDGTVYEGQSRILISSLSNAKDELGAEYDYVYLNQPELSEEDDWQFLATRCNGRRGVAPYPQLFGDPNPEHEQHWIKKGGDAGRWTLIKSTYRDNPVIWDQKLQCFTKAGEEQIGRLIKSLNPVMAKRLIDGEWCSFEGLVYGEAWDRTVHLQPRDKYNITNDWERYWAIDYGFTDPFVCLFFAKNPEKEEYVLYRYIYHTNRTIPQHIESIRNLTIDEPRPKLIIADRNPESQAVLINGLGLNVTQATKGAGSIKAGINIVTDMLKNKKIVVLQDSLVELDASLASSKSPIGLEQEIENYRWNPDRPDEPIGGDDHALDAARYLFSHIKATQKVVPFIWT